MNKGRIEAGNTHIYLGPKLDITYDPEYRTVDFGSDGAAEVIIWTDGQLSEIDRLIEVLKEAREDIK